MIPERIIFVSQGIAVYQISRKSVQWKPRCYMRTDGHDEALRNSANLYLKARPYRKQHFRSAASAAIWLIYRQFRGRKKSTRDRTFPMMLLNVTILWHMTHFTWQLEEGYLFHLPAISAPCFLTEYNHYPQAAYPSQTTLKMAAVSSPETSVALLINTTSYSKILKSPTNRYTRV